MKYYNLSISQIKMMSQNPFQPFIQRMNNDLANWLNKEKETKNLLRD